MEDVALSTLQIDLLAKSHPILGRIYKKTCASDELPHEAITDPRAAFVVNVDRHDKEGSHWIGLYVEHTEDRNTCWVFDSYGMPMRWYKRCPIWSWINTRYDTIIGDGSNVQVQTTNSSSCGHYALFF